jgi:hypothetical protein
MISPKIRPCRIKTSPFARSAVSRSSKPPGRSFPPRAECAHPTRSSPWEPIASRVARGTRRSWRFRSRVRRPRPRAWPVHRWSPDDQEFTGAWAGVWEQHVLHRPRRGQGPHLLLASMSFPGITWAQDPADPNYERAKAFFEAGSRASVERPESDPVVIAQGLRIRASRGAPDSSSLRPFRMVSRVSPVAAETTESPPSPIARDSVAAQRRRVRSSS